jgi:3-dehydroquinate synthase
MNALQVSNYRVCISDDLRELTRTIGFADFSETVLLVDENTRACCLPRLLAAAPSLKNALILEIPSGEAFKNINTCSHLWKELLDKNIDRTALIINLGGGVIGDMGGFVAATYKRGIAFINIPTTLLAQVDATIGGKLGVDFGNVKNAVGVFVNPSGVLIHPAFLKTLPDGQLLSGFAEMIKHGLISSKKHWDKIRSVNPLKEKSWSRLIHDSL